MNRDQLHTLLTEARKQVQHAEFVIVGSLAIIERRAASAPALDGELAPARHRMAQHRKRLSPG